ncbi:MAG: OsmC family peroxiredoxin [Bacteroidetes bacterium]|nr:MAG: OsmC family peroxiredoxin [Bacteroidota bacterium]
MTTHQVSVEWLSDMAFKGTANGHEIIMDAEEHVGGKNFGPRPKPLMLLAAGGCTGMDVIPILKKMQVVPEYFRMEISGEVTEDHPKQYNKIHIIYEFRGKNLPLDKLQKAVHLSQEKYCGVSATLKKAMPVSWEIRIMD